MMVVRESAEADFMPFQPVVSTTVTGPADAHRCLILSSGRRRIPRSGGSADGDWLPTAASARSRFGSRHAAARINRRVP